MTAAVFITGASSGIGEFLAYEFARRGYRLSLCARRADRLREVANRCLKLSAHSQPLICTGDVTSREDLDHAVAKTLQTFGSIQIVIANAGFGVAGRFEKLTLEDFQRQFRTNVDGVINTVHASLEALKASKGSLVLMGSVNSYVSQPKKAPYCMSKFAVRALAESLYAELKPYEVAVTLICPGMVTSEIRQVDNQGQRHPEALATPPAWLTMATDKAARKMTRAILRRKREVIITGHGALGIWLSRLVPGILLKLLARFNLQGYENKLRPLH